jgi:hypothetical protein
MRPAARTRVIETRLGDAVKYARKPHRCATAAMELPTMPTSSRLHHIAPSRFALLLGLVAMVGCKSMDDRRKEYGAELQKKMPEGCEVKPQMGAYTIDCAKAADKDTAITKVLETVKGECSALGGLKISSVALSTGGAGYYESYGVKDGDCELKKK